jgi:threonine synthase
MAAYAAVAGLRALVLIPEGKIAYGKLAQALAHGARTLQVQGDFDAAMQLVRQVCDESGIYLLNSLNPFRIEGQKAIIFELLQQRRWEPPDWIVFPAGNLGNTSAFGKALHELQELGLLSRLPRMAAVQARGANPFYRSFANGFERRERVTANTIASAIRIGNPVSYDRAIRSLRWTEGLVTEVSDEEILNGKAQVDGAGIGCEPASAAAVAGARRLAADGIIRPGESVVAILTGHLLKDPGATVDYHLGRLENIDAEYANRPRVIESTLEAVRTALQGGAE